MKKFFACLFTLIFIVLIGAVVAYFCVPKVKDEINRVLRVGEYHETIVIKQTTKDKIDAERFPEYTEEYNFIVSISNAGRVVEDKFESITYLNRIKSLKVIGYNGFKEVFTKTPELKVIGDSCSRIATIPIEFAVVFTVDCSEVETIELVYELNDFDNKTTKERSNLLKLKDYNSDSVITHLTEVA